jgi:hypothetical protein
MATATRRSSNRTARSAELNAKPTLTPVPDPAETPQPKPQPPAKPLATIDLGARPVTYYFPQITLGTGEVVSCSHSRYGHETEASARRCALQLVSTRGHRVEK